MTKQELDAKYAGADIVINGDHPDAGTHTKFVEMVPSDRHPSGLLMRVKDSAGVVHDLPPTQVFHLLKKTDATK